MITKFYGIYKSSKSGKMLSTKAKDDILFPPNILFNSETYLHTGTFTVSTPQQEANFAKYLDRTVSDRDINF